MFEHNYGSVDRLLHRIAFHSDAIQLAVADIENTLFSKELKLVSVIKPVFITSLPRAGTTLLLDMLSGLDVFSSQIYADMPFVLCPLFWQRFTNQARKSNNNTRERAHGDGVMMSVNSPESFEEVLWRAYWKPVMTVGQISVWNDKLPAKDFQAAFDKYMRKVMLSRQKPSEAMVRYLSKNNANIARIRFIKKMFPDSFIVVPFRNPNDHIDSLFRQHQNFLQLHKTDSFAKEYMRYVGHLEFGELAMPIDFNGWTKAYRNLRPDTREFWLEYWCATFSYLLKHHVNEIIFLNYDRMVEDSQHSLRSLAQVIEVDPSPLMQLGKRYIRLPKEKETSSATTDARLEVIYAGLKQLAINRCARF